jgi:CheY-like chemotaxis protein
MHGGTVMAASKGLANGSTFTIVLPSYLSAALGPHHPPPGAAEIQRRPIAFKKGQLNGLTVLVVDDEKDARRLVKRVLEEFGAAVSMAGSAAEAFDLLPLVKPDVLVSDIGMPEMDGYELLRRIRTLPPAQGGEVPAIALSALARTEDRSRALRAGFMVHMAKPVEPHELVATVATVGSGGSSSGLR